MSPSENDKEKPTSISPVIYVGFEGFRSKEEKEWYVKYFRTREVLTVEPLYTMYGRVAPPGLQGWEEALKNTEMCNLTLVREFCASLIKVNSYCYHAYVRGVPITLSPSLVAHILGVEEVLDYEFPFKSGAMNIPSFDRIASTLTGQSCSWDGKNLVSRDLTVNYHNLHKNLCRYVFPTTNIESLNIWQACILYAIGTCMKVDLAHCFIDYIIPPTKSTSMKNYIRCGWLITKICIDAGLEYQDGDEIHEPFSRVSDFNVRGSVCQKKRKYVVESTRGPLEPEEDKVLSRARQSKLCHEPSSKGDLVAINTTLTRIMSMINTMDKRLDLVRAEVAELKTLVKLDELGFSVHETDNV